MSNMEKSVPDSTKSPDADDRLSELYETLIEIQRDQINTQLSHADTNELKVIGIMGAVVAIIVACFAIKSVSTNPSFNWWWLPLLGFLPSFGVLALPLRGPGWFKREKRTFSAGPLVPEFLSELRQQISSGEVVTFQSSLILLLQSLEASRRENDKLLLNEARQFRTGLWFLCLAAITVLSLYAWKLT